MARQPRLYPMRWFDCFLSDIPPVAGCYAIYRCGKLIYIGSTTNLRTRMVTHRTGPHSISFKDGRSYVKIKIARRFGEWLMREARLIARLRPPENLNGAHVRTQLLNHERFLTEQKRLALSR